jgi:hypothetical protein
VPRRFPIADTHAAPQEGLDTGANRAQVALELPDRQWAQSTGNS